MKRRILAFVVVLLLAAVTLMPMAVSAASSGTTVITATVAAAAPTVTSISPNSGAQGNTYASIVIAGTNLTGATAVNLGAGITVNDYSVDSDSQVTANISITSGAATGVRDISVTTPGGTGTKTGGFTVVASTISVSAPANFSLGTMARGAFTQGPEADWSVTTNAQRWQVIATGASSHGGHMYNGSANLSSLLQFSKDGSHWDTADSNLTYTQNDIAPLAFFVQQQVTSTDPAGSYSITITFTGSIQ